MSWDTELALLFKERDNNTVISAEIGVVKSLSPLRVSLFDGKAFAHAKNSIKTQTIQNLLDSTSSDRLKIDDSVLIIPMTGYQKFFIVDRVVI